MGDGRAEGLLAKGDRGQAAISLMPDVHRRLVHIFESLQLESSYIGDFYIVYANINICMLNIM